ncbi:MAG TPA: cytochrome b5-like heme/steroid binding domain-containing protein [Patescibacteria group bacterium]|nr:cytochrome b5-like heme/steroid binding domain-containing protein [Patescibacteria group bacterium]
MKKLLVLPVILLLAAGCAAQSKTPSPSAPGQSSPSSLTPTSTPQTAYAMDQVAAAKSKDKCWAAIGGKVYDLTNWIAKHPGGPDKILGICGTDATAAFGKQHGSDPRANDVLSTVQIGTLQQ